MKVSILIFIVLIQFLYGQVPPNSAYSNGLVGCTNGQSSDDYICYSNGGVSLPKYCTVPCLGGDRKLIFDPASLSSSWRIYVTVQGAFQSSGGSSVSAVGPCQKLTNYINNPIAWGGEYLTTAVPFINAVTSTASTFCNTAPANSAYSNGLVGCTNGQSSNDYICYSNGGVSLPKYCTVACFGGAEQRYFFDPAALSSSWRIYVTVQGAYQVSGGSSTTQVGPCSKLSNYINNPIAWGGEYLTTAVPFIQAVTAVTTCPAVPPNSYYTNGLVGCTNGQSSNDYICYSNGGVALPKYCLMTCGGVQQKYIFNPASLSGSWRTYVTVQGAYQSSGGSSVSAVGACQKLASYINNPIAWGGEYLTTAVPFIQSVTSAVQSAGCTLSVGGATTTLEQTNGLVIPNEASTESNTQSNNEISTLSDEISSLSEQLNTLDR